MGRLKRGCREIVIGSVWDVHAYEHEHVHVQS